MQMLSQYFSADILYFLILALIFAAVISLVFGCYYLFFVKNPVSERLKSLVKKPTRMTDGQNRAGSALVEKDPQGLTTKISHSLKGILPNETADKLGKTRIRLTQAGFRSKKAYYNYIACKILCALLFPGMFVISLFFFKVTPERLVLVIALALFGFFLPNFFVYLRAQNRKDELTKALPDALDLMVVCVEAGLGLDMTFKRIGEEIRNISKNLSDEFMITNLEVRSGLARQEAFNNMAHRTGVPEIRQLMTMLNQTSRFGTSLATALRVHSDSMRVKRRQIAEEIAAKAAIRLLFPLLTCIFPALFVVMIGPAVIRIMRVLLPSLQGG